MKLICDDGTEVDLEFYGPDAYGKATWMGEGYVVTHQAEEEAS